MESLPNTPDHIPARELLTVMPVAVEGFNKLLSRNRTPENRILGAIDHMERENSNVYEGMKEGLDKLKVDESDFIQEYIAGYCTGYMLLHLQAKSTGETLPYISSLTLGSFAVRLWANHRDRFDYVAKNYRRHIEPRNRLYASEIEEMIEHDFVDGKLGAAYFRMGATAVYDLLSQQALFNDYEDNAQLRALEHPVSIYN